MAWAELVELAAYAQRIASERGLKLRVGVATNACISEKAARWMAQNCTHVNVSLDGPPRIQDRTRPKRGGGPSSPAIRRALRIFEEAEVPYAIQATVTRKTVARMPSIAAYFARHMRPHEVKFEPVVACGRFVGQEEEAPEPLEFARRLDEAYEVAQKHGLRVMFSGMRLGGPGLSHFCGAFGEPFDLTPDGHISACYEACSGASEYAEAFLIGRYNPGARSFSVDEKKLDRLRQRHVYNLDACQKCFCKYSCAGDCATRNFRANGNQDLMVVGARCDMIREVARRRLGHMVDRAEAGCLEKQETAKDG